MDMSIETSIPVRTTHFTVPSPCGRYLASVNGSHLDIRELSTLDMVRTVILSQPNHARYLRLEWSPTHDSSSPPLRLLLATEASVRIWDLTDRYWSATIDNGSGSMGPIAYAEFGADENQVLIFSSFTARLAIWNLKTGKKVELKDPKFATPVGFGRNKESRSGTFALLTRTGAQDVLSLHAPGSYDVMKNIVLPTVDAQGLKWSRGGKWLAVWDTPSFGYKVLIYTADGNLYRTYSGDYFDDELVGLGLRTIEWSPNGQYCAVSPHLVPGDYYFVLTDVQIGGYDNTVTLLSTTTFTPATYLAHRTTLKACSFPTWQESVTSATTPRTYTPLPTPTTLPTAKSTPPTTTLNLASKIQSPASIAPALSITHLTFNPTTTLLATRSTATPTTLHLWDLRTLQPHTILVQHAVIRSLHWHPTNPDLLAITCVQDAPIVYLFDAGADTSAPLIIDLSLSPAASVLGAGAGAGGVGTAPKYDIKWASTRADEPPALLVGSERGFVVVYPEGRSVDTPLGTGTGGEAVSVESHGFAAKDVFSNGHGSEAGHEALSTLPVRDGAGTSGAERFSLPGSAMDNDDDIDGAATAALEDTFNYRRGVGVGVGVY